MDDSRRRQVNNPQGACCAISVDAPLNAVLLLDGTYAVNSSVSLPIASFTAIFNRVVAYPIRHSLIRITPPQLSEDRWCILTYGFSASLNLDSANAREDRKCGSRSNLPTTRRSCRRWRRSSYHRTLREPFSVDTKRRVRPRYRP